MKFKFKFKAQLLVVCEVVEAVDTVFCAKISVICRAVVNKCAGEANKVVAFLHIDVVNFCIDCCIFA